MVSFIWEEFIMDDDSKQGPSGCIVSKNLAGWSEKLMRFMILTPKGWLLKSRNLSVHYFVKGF
jgi:hypothetical protein